MSNDETGDRVRVVQIAANVFGCNGFESLRMVAGFVGAGNMVTDISIKVIKHGNLYTPMAYAKVVPGR